MAALETQVPVLLIGIVLLAPFTALVSAESSREKIQIGLLHLNPDNAGTNDEQSLQARGLFDSFGSLFNTAVWNTPTGSDSAKREVAEEEDRWEEEHEHVDDDDEHDYDEHVAKVTKGKGTTNSFNNFGTGKQNFHGASISIGGDDGQDFSGAAIGSIGSINVGNNVNNGGIQRNGGISISGIGSANSINVGGNRNINGIQTNSGVRIGSIGNISSDGISIDHIGADGISIGNIGSDGISINGGHIVIGGNINDGISNMIFGNNYIQIDSNGGVIIHVIDSGNHGLNMINNQIYIGNKMICSTKTKSFAKPTYQKTPEGARWYTNVKVGTPMTPAEIAQFEKDWAEILKEQEETKKRLKKEAEERERKHKEWERQHKEQMAALDARLAREEEERERKHKEWERQHKEQMDALNARLAREEEEKERERKERERQQKERMALQARLKREAEARARQQQEWTKERERQQEERARQQEERDRVREIQRQERDKERERRDREREKERERREKEKERRDQEREKERERREQERMSWRQQREARRTPSWSRGDSFSWW